jgi:hypothetical protein
VSGAPYATLDATALRASILAGERTAADAVRSAFTLIAEPRPELRAFLSTIATGRSRGRRSSTTRAPAARSPARCSACPWRSGQHVFRGLRVQLRSRILAG